MNTANSLRIWETPDYFHCQLIGTCLSIAELTKLTKKFYGPNIPQDAFQVHGIGVHGIKENTPYAKAIEKYLNRKYALSIKRNRALSVEALPELWDDAVGEGKICGALWAFITRRDAPHKILEKVFGDVHMMSHLLGAERRVDLKEVSELRKALSCAREESDSLRRHLDKTKIKMETLRQERNEWRRKGDNAARENSVLTEKIRLLESGGENTAKAREMGKLIAAKNEMKRAVERLNKKVMMQAVVIAEQEREIEEGLGEAKDVARTLNSCPLRRGQADPNVCLRRFLCEKRILLVGGMDKLSPHYRRIIEQLGGCFQRHDGDVRSGLATLEEQIARADVVLCPVDCNSHGACKCVKIACKRFDKNHLFPRNSSVSMLCRSLMEVAMDAGVS